MKEGTNMKKLTAILALVLMAITPQLSHGEDNEKVFDRVSDFGDRIGDFAAQLAKIRKDLRETTYETTTPIAIIILSIDNIQAALFFEAVQVHNFTYVAPVKRTRKMYVAENAETWKFAVNPRIEKGMNMIQKNYIYIADTAQLHLIDQAKETIGKGVQLVDEAMTYLEAHYGEPEKQ
jgi:hypothetical protein